MRRLACIASVLLTACAATPAPIVAEPAAPALVSVGAEVKSWGVTLRQWDVNADGQVEFTSGGRPGANPATVTIEVRRFALGRGARHDLSLAVHRVELELAKSEQCDQSVTDGPYGKFRWDWGKGQQELPFTANCVKGRDAALANAIFAADKIVEDAAMTVQPVERRPATQQR